LRNLEVKFRDPRVSFLEGVLSRGDRRLSGVIESAFRNGARLDSWSEHFNYEFWERAFNRMGINPESYTSSRSLEEPLPWQHIDKGVPPGFLREERQNSYEGIPRGIGHKKAPLSDFGLVEGEAATDSSFGRSRKRKAPVHSQSIPRSLLRVKWSKGREARYTSHLENMRVFERAMRRADVPVAYSHGFHPHQRVAYGPPLALGFTSEAEYFDMQLTAPYEPTVVEHLNQALPPGFSVREFHLVWSKVESLSKIINAASYQVKSPFAFQVAREGAESILNSESLKVKRTRKENVEEIEGRPHILNLEALEVEGTTLLNMTLAFGGLSYRTLREKRSEVFNPV